MRAYAQSVTYIDCDKIYSLDKDVNFRDCEKLCAIILLRFYFLFEDLLHGYPPLSRILEYRTY